MPLQEQNWLENWRPLWVILLHEREICCYARKHRVSKKKSRFHSTPIIPMMALYQLASCFQLQRERRLQPAGMWTLESFESKTCAYFCIPTSWCLALFPKVLTPSSVLSSNTPCETKSLFAIRLRLFRFEVNNCKDAFAALTDFNHTSLYFAVNNDYFVRRVRT